MLEYPTTSYFRHVRQRPDRVMIQDEWIVRVIEEFDREEIQDDGRVRRWKRIVEAERRALRVILLADRLTVHNAFFDRDFQECDDEGQVF